MKKSPRGVSKAKLWSHVGGPLLAAGAASAIELLSRGPFKIPNPPAFLLLIVVFSAFIGGVRSGLITALIAWLYFVYFFSTPGQPLLYTAENLRRVIVWAVTTPTMAIMVGILQRRAERAFQISQENAVLTEQVAERKRTEQSLKQSEARNAAVLRGALDCIITMDQKGRVLEFNPAAEATFAYGRDDVLGRELGELIIPPGLRDHHRRGLAHYLATGESPILNKRIEITAARATGEEFPVELTVIRDPSSDPPVFTGFVRDITARKRAEEAREQLAAIVESSDDAILGKTLDGIILSWNLGAERMYGYRAGEVVGQPVSLLAPPDRADEAPSILERVKRGAGVEHHETVRVRKDGTRIDVALTVSPIKDAAGSIIGASTIARDITERKQAEREIRTLNRELEERVRQRTAQLEAANQELEAFAYSAAHDLRAPLITIGGFSRMLIEDHASSLPDQAQRYLHEVDQSAQKMSNLINDLLAFSRLGRQPIKEQPVSLADVARQALAELNGGRAGWEASVRIGDLPPCRADPALLKQVLVNLLSNAQKFSRRRAEAVIEVGWRRDLDDPTHRAYFVKDNGAGFDMRHADKLFRVFQRLHRAEDYEGTGIGLAIVQRIIKRHGGRVWAEGEPEKGATFYFTLPRSGAA